jgi:Na+/melibiose symporter-like transporter
MGRSEAAHARFGDARLTVAARRRALRLGYVNGVLWSVGNGLTSGTLVYYLAQELGASGAALSLLIAAPSLIGLLRLATPALIGPLGGVKATCLKTSLVSYLLLTIGLPVVTLAGFVSRPATLTALIVLICVHQLLEYVGSVALWSWLGALVPQRVRGRYFARRNLWQLAFLTPTLLMSGLLIDSWKRAHRGEPDQILAGYVLPATLGGLFLLASLAPLWRLPDVASARRRGGALRRAVLAMLMPIFDARFRRLLIYRGWFSFFNGITQAAQNVFVYRVLKMEVLPMQQLQLGMRVGQMALSPAVGRASDRYGNRPVLELSQLLVAAGLLFYAMATPAAWWWIVGAWALWSAYVGINVCLNNLMLRLAPAKENAGYIALCEATGGLAFGLSTIAGGVLLDQLQARGATLALGPLTLDHFAILFVSGAILRAAGVIWLSRVREPGAWRWREMFGAR